MRYKKVADMLVSKFGLTPIANPSNISQNGRYLVFESIEALSPAKNRLNFMIVIAANSLNEDKDSALSECEAVCDGLLVLGSLYKQSFFSGVKAYFSTSSLYLYAINVSVEVSKTDERCS